MHVVFLPWHSDLDGDLIIVEGVMGLFDGEPHAANLALRSGLPVPVVIDVSSMAGTLGTLAYGLQHYCPSLRCAGLAGESRGHSISKSFESRRQDADSADARQGETTTTRMI